MCRCCAVIGLVTLLAVPAAMAAQYDFVLDASKPSFIRITLPVFAGGQSTSSPLSGTYSLMLGDPSGAYNTRNWNVLASLKTVNAMNTTTMIINSPTSGIYVQSNPGDFRAMDWNQDKGAIPSTTLAGGPNISSTAATMTTGILVSLFNQLTGTYITANGAAGEWDAMPWNIQVSDDDWLAVAGTGDVESHVWATYFDKNLIKYEVQLYGRGTLVPEPAAVSLLVLGGLALLRRRPS